MKRLFDWIPAPAPDSDSGFAGMTVHTNNRKLRSIEYSLKLALMPVKGEEGVEARVRYPAFQRAEFYSTSLNLGKAKKNPTAAQVRITPLSARESGVPMLSASAPKGTALRGMSPKVIMAMLTMRPRISRVE